MKFKIIWSGKNKVERRVWILSKCYCDQCRNSVLRFPGGTLIFSRQKDLEFCCQNHIVWRRRKKSNDGSGFCPNVTVTSVATLYYVFPAELYLFLYIINLLSQFSQYFVCMYVNCSHSKFTPGWWCILLHIVGSGSSRLDFHLLGYEEVGSYLLDIPPCTGNWETALVDSLIR